MLEVHNSLTTIPSRNCVHGHLVIGVAESVIGVDIINLRYGIILLADVENAANIWIGRTGVTANKNATTGGFPIVPGGSIMLPFSDLQKIYGISTDVAQNLAWIGM